MLLSSCTGDCRRRRGPPFSAHPGSYGYLPQRRLARALCVETLSFRAGIQNPSFSPSLLTVPPVCFFPRSPLTIVRVNAAGLFCVRGRMGEAVGSFTLTEGGSSPSVEGFVAVVCLFVVCWLFVCRDVWVSILRVRNQFSSSSTTSFD